MNSIQSTLTSKQILNYFLGDEELQTAIICENRNFTTTDKELYEALGSLQEYEQKDHRLLVKFLENVDIESAKNKGEVKEILTFEKIDKIRNNALRRNLKWEKQ